MCLVTQSCSTHCDPIDCSPPGSCVHGILQARILEWVATFSSRGSSWPKDWTWVSCTAGRVFNNWATRNVTQSLQQTHEVDTGRVLFYSWQDDTEVGKVACTRSFINSQTRIWPPDNLWLQDVFNLIQFTTLHIQDHKWQLTGKNFNFSRILEE